MHILYLDDSGSPGNPSEDYFVLGGVSVPENSIRWLSYEIEKIAQELTPQDPASVEFHAAEVFSGKVSPWDALTNKQDRISIIQRVLHTIDNAYQDTVVFACAVHKASYPREDVVIHAYEEIASRFNLYLQRISEQRTVERGIIVIDKTSYEAGLQNLTGKIRREGNRWGDYMTSLVEVPLFIDSRASRVVQLADHISYAVFRRYNANDLTYFNIIESRFDQREGVICGLAHKISTYRTCTCPACLSRR